MLYLAYGSNLHPRRLGARIEISAIRGTVTLTGWGLRWHKRGHDGSGKCDLVAARDEIAYGVVYEITNAAMAQLHRIEGLGHGYALAYHKLGGFDQVYGYHAQKSYIDPSLRPYRWYRDLVIAGLSHFNFPSAYIEQYRKIPAWRDPDPARHRKNTVPLLDFGKK